MRALEQFDAAPGIFQGLAIDMDAGPDMRPHLRFPQNR